MYLEKTIHKNKEFFKFLAVGCASSLINLFVFYLIFYLLKVNELMSSTIAYLVGVFFGFLFNKNWTFNNKQKRWVLLLGKYFLVYTFNLFVGLLSFNFINQNTSLEEIVIQLLIIMITAFCNFFGLKFFVFR